MKSLPDLKKKAVLLRRKGLSYNQIREHIFVSKSTLSLWLKEVPLKEIYRKKLYSKRIYNLSLGSQSQKERRARQVEIITESAKKEVLLPLSTDAYRLYGAALYWAEGSKGRGLEITNSDPGLIIFMVTWFEKILNIKPDSLTAYLNIYPQQDESKLKKFWSDLCQIPLKNFRKSSIKPPNKSYKKNNLYYGTIKIRVPKSTDMRIRVFGWIQKTLEDLNPSIEKVQKKWGRLKKVARSVNII